MVGFTNDERSLIAICIWRNTGVPKELRQCFQINEHIYAVYN